MTLRVWRPAGFDGLELNLYRGRNERFPPSLVTGLNAGVRLAGVRETSYRGRRFTSGPGAFLAYRPGFGMTAQPVGEGSWSYADVTLPPELAADLLGDAAPALDRAALAGPVAPDLEEVLPGRFRESFESLRAPASRLERETKLLAWLEPLVRESPLERASGGREHRAVARIREYLHDLPGLDASLADLERLTGLSRHHLLRVFKRATGLTPHRYQAGLRVARAKTLLSGGTPPARVASEIGLYDQSALNRLFRRYALTTPGRYQEALKSEPNGSP